MQANIPQLSDFLQHTLPAIANAAAGPSHFCQRKAKVFTDLERSLVRASKLVQEYVGMIIYSLNAGLAMASVIAQLAEELRLVPKVNKRRSKPSTAQQLQQPNTLWWT